MRYSYWKNIRGGACIIAAFCIQNSDCFYIRVSHPSFDPVPEGGMIPVMDCPLVVKKERDIFAPLI